MGLAGVLGHLWTADEPNVAKPTERAFLAVYDRLRLPPAAVVRIGDLHDLDVVAARAAGLRAVHLDRLDPGPQHTGSRGSGSPVRRSVRSADDGGSGFRAGGRR